MCLVDTGAEVTVLHGDSAPNEATSQICSLGDSSTPALQAKVALTIDVTPFVTKVLISPIKEYILGNGVLAGHTVETLNDHFCFVTPQVAFAT